ncbi:translation initiation factor IF-2 [bacterium]|nr:translation initiation factor IF-2 [bacterium]
MDDSKPLMKILRDMGYDVKTASNTLSDEAVKKIREVVAPHMDQARPKETHMPKVDEPKKNTAPVPAAKMRTPDRVVRIANRATSAEKEAILDRHRRKLLGESPVETALEAKQSIQEPVVVPPPVVEVAPPVAEVVIEEISPQAPVTAPVIAATGAAPVEAPKVTEAQAAVDAGRPRPVPVDQQIAAEYRDRPTPAAAVPVAPAPPAPAAPDNRGGFQKPPGGPKTREISPSRGPKKPVKPGVSVAPGLTHQQKPPGRFGRHQGGRGGPRRHSNVPVRVETVKALDLPELISVADLASRLSISPGEVIKALIKEGQMVSINQALDYATAARLAEGYGFIVAESIDELPDMELLETEDDGELQPRPAVVTVLGHVDHGKTSLLDAIRSANVTASEAGGITQRIGAYTVKHGDEEITFIDTPGHEAFTQMRARGAQVTDIAILVVAADDGVMPQTVEAINHAKAAKVPIIVAVNKIDKPNANPDKVLQQLTEYNLVPESWGGDTITVGVSALKKEGITELLEMIQLVSEMQNLRANPDRPATGSIIEAGLDKGVGPVATVLVQNGTLRVGDTIVVGRTWGRVRGLRAADGKNVKFAGPSYPAEIIGLNEIPNAGDHMQVVEDEKVAKQVAEARSDKSRANRIRAVGGKTSLEDFLSTSGDNALKEFRVIVKADGQGSLEALLASLDKQSTDEVKLVVTHSAVGAIRESDVMLANASQAMIIGFNVRPDASVKRLAEQDGVEIRLYRVIYHMLEEIRKAMAGLLAPDVSEVFLGRVEVRQVLKVTRVGKIAGCYVVEGKITRDSEVRLVRDGILIHEGRLESLKRFKDDAREVSEGFECGLTILNYPDVQEGDILEAFRKEVTAREDL